MTVWLLLIGIFNPIVNVLFLAFEFIALFQAKELAHDDSQSVSTIVQATTLEAQVSEDLLKFVIGALSSSLVLLWNGDNWIEGQNRVLARGFEVKEPIVSSTLSHRMATAF